jgi:hypothetical protein
MTRQQADVSIVVPTMATRERAASLFRALDSVVSQDGVRGLPLVVVNGGAASPEVLAHLRRRPDIRLTTLAEASLPHALRVGRARVDTPYFAVLDDDDTLLPGALRTRLDLLESTGADVAVTNGFEVGHGRRDLNLADFARAQADPLRALLVDHWLPPCAGAFRTDTVVASFFEDIPPYREWTYLALRFALALRIRFAAQPTFVYATDTPHALSRSKAYCMAGPAALQRMLALGLPADVRRALRVRLASALHSAAALELEDGNYRAAWWWHCKSCVQPSGWHYLLYTRKLLAGSVAALMTVVRTPGTGPV